jgi:hypothetical protein
MKDSLLKKIATLTAQVYNQDRDEDDHIEYSDAAITIQFVPEFGVSVEIFVGDTFEVARAATLDACLERVTEKLLSRREV